MARDRFDLTGKTALVTGSTRGLGKVMARALAGAGAHVVVHGRRLDTATAVAGEISGPGGTSATAFDMTDEAALCGAVRDLVATAGGVDILVNNAGMVSRAPIERFPSDAWQTGIDTMLTGPFLLIRELSAPMITAGWGRIVNIGSVMTRIGRDGIHHYLAAKTGLVGVTRGLAYELGPKGITCNCISPGYFATEINQDLQTNAAFDTMLKSRVPLHRWGRPEELEGALLLLASDAGSFINGHELVIDGGLSTSL